jgi:hypothetical protein
MRDDFAALDFLAAGGAEPGSYKKLAKKLAKKFGKKRKNSGEASPRRVPQSNANRALTELLPKIAAKVKPVMLDKTLQGWPVTLSWPDKKDLH